MWLSDAVRSSLEDASDLGDNRGPFGVGFDGLSKYDFCESGDVEPGVLAFGVLGAADIRIGAGEGR